MAGTDNTEVSYIKFELRALEPFMIANPEDTALVDRPLVRSADGSPVVPASGLVGSLRAHCAGVLGQAVKDSFGTSFGDGAIEPSSLRALGTDLSLPSGDAVGASRIRLTHKTAIDAKRGAPESSTLRTGEEAPSGATIKLWCEFDGRPTEQFWTAVKTWSPTIGGAIGTGHGRAELVGMQWGVLDLATTEGLTKYLSGITPETIDGLTSTDLTLEPRTERTDEPVIDLRFDIVDALLTRGMQGAQAQDGADERANLTQPLRRKAISDGPTADGELVLEGSSLRGVLRSRVRFIGGSLAEANAFDCPEKTPSEIGQIIADAVFGSTELRGHFSVDTAVLAAKAKTEERHHVAIDRFTGGAHPGLLFSDEVVTVGGFELKVRPLGPAAPEWAKALLLAACRDLHDGLVGVGSATSRGYGTVRCSAPADLEDALPIPESIITCIDTYLKSRNSAPAEARQESQSASSTRVSAEAEQPDGITTDSASGQQAVRSRFGRVEIVERAGLSWQECRERVINEGMTALWSGLDGMSTGTGRDIPEIATAGTHLWAWSDGLWLRARVVSGVCYTTLVRPGSSGTHKDATETARVRVDRLSGWSITQPRLSKRGRNTMGQPGLDQQWALVVGVYQPMTFLHCGNEPAMWASGVEALSWLPVEHDEAQE